MLAPELVAGPADAEDARSRPHTAPSAARTAVVFVALDVIP
jgi:hypothetical protein